MNAPEAADQIVSGIFSLEDNRFRWMSRSAVVALEESPGRPAAARDVHHPAASARAPRHAAARWPRSGVADLPGARHVHAWNRRPCAPAGAVAMVEIAVDQTFFAPPDSRELGIVLTGVGFAP